MHASPGEAASLIDKKVVHNAGKPRPGLVDPGELIELAIRLDQELLKKVLGLCFAARQSPGETIQPVEVRPDEAFKREVCVTYGRLPLSEAYSKKQVVIDENCCKQEAQIADRKPEGFHRQFLVGGHAIHAYGVIKKKDIQDDSR